MEYRVILADDINVSNAIVWLFSVFVSQIPTCLPLFQCIGSPICRYVGSISTAEVFFRARVSDFSQRSELSMYVSFLFDIPILCRDCDVIEVIRFP